MWQPVKPRDFRGALHLWWPNAVVGMVTAMIGGRDRIFRFHLGLSICCRGCGFGRAAASSPNNWRLSALAEPDTASSLTGLYYTAPTAGRAAGYGGSAI